MQQGARNSIQNLDYFRQENQKARQLRYLLHGHDRHWHRAGSVLREREELESVRDTIGVEGGKDFNIINLAADTRQERLRIQPVAHQSQPCSDLKNDWRRKFVRLTLEFCALILNLDLLGGEVGGQHYVHINLFKGFIRLRLFSYTIIDKSSWFRRSRWHSFLPRLVLLIYTCCTVHLIYYLYHQYIYDYYRFRLMRVRWLNATHLEEARARKLTLERENELLQLIETSEQTIQRIGGPQRHVRFAVEAVYLMFLFTSLLVYLFTQFSYKLVTPFDFYFVRNFIDYSGEQHRQHNFVRDQVRTFINSSRNHTRALVCFSRKSFSACNSRPVGQMRSKSMLFNGVGNIKKKRDKRLSEIGRAPEADDVGAATAASAVGELDQPVFTESFSCKQLRSMLQSCDLWPMNQTPGWVARQMHRFCYLWLFCLLIAFFFDSGVVYLIFLYIDPSRKMTWNDALVNTDLIWLISICNISTLFYTTVNVFTVIDQAELARNLNALIELVIDLNNLRFHRNSQLGKTMRHLNEARYGSVRLKGQSGGLETLLNARSKLDMVTSRHQFAMFDPNYKNAMNKDILLALMHYKTFVAALIPLKRSLRAAAFIVVIVMFLFPVISRVHMPYFKLERGQDARILTIGLSLLLLLPVNINLIPICYLHKRCMSLYHQLNSLLAHVTDIISYPAGDNIYDPHIVSILRKELCFSESVESQFVIKVNGFSFTYPGLIRLHFYFGFIILSIISENQASQENVVSTLLHDPFGIF